MSSIKKGGDGQDHSEEPLIQRQQPFSLLLKAKGQGGILGAPDFSVETPIRSPGEPEVMEQTGSLQAHKAGSVALAWPPVS